MRGGDGGWVINVGSEKYEEFLYSFFINFQTELTWEFLWHPIDHELLCKIHAFGFVFVTTVSGSVLCCCGCLARSEGKPSGNCDGRLGSHLGHVWRCLQKTTQICEPSWQGMFQRLCRKMSDVDG